MNPEQLAGELGLPGAQEVLRDSAIARLAYNGPDGFPRVIPCGFWWTGTAIVICTAPTAPKTTALAARPEVAITIDTSGPGGERSLLLRGSAVLDTVDGVAEEYLAAAAKTMSNRTSPVSSTPCGPPMTRWSASPSPRSGRVFSTSAPGVFLSS
jgi:nitroimidazol reductase NimA-like FMN-containing flavoprotein (pyridoxamine 5'-phosphate oxidase superfamily)